MIGDVSVYSMGRDNYTPETNLGIDWAIFNKRLSGLEFEVP